MNLRCWSICLQVRGARVILLLVFMLDCVHFADLDDFFCYVDRLADCVQVADNMDLLLQLFMLRRVHVADVVDSLVVFSDIDACELLNRCDLHASSCDLS